MQAELTQHVGYDKHDSAGHHTGNSRSGARLSSGTNGHGS